MITTSKCPQCGEAISDHSAHKLCPKCLLGAGLAGGSEPLSAATAAYVHGADELGWTLADLEQRFPHLEILDMIGRGGMGAVYRARQRTLDRVVAIKVLPAKASRDPSFAERFVREARTMAKLNHPNVVTVYEFGEQDGLYFFLMEFVDGANLRSLMTEGSLQSGEALSIVGQVCDALQYAHDMGIVHRDIKPENVLIDQRGQVKIADFGLAKILAKPATDVTLTGVHQVVGTPHYMAPEQMEKPTEVDHRADIYSLGVVFYELLTGELPLGRFARPSEKASIDAKLDDVVLRTLEKEPANRYQSAVAMKTACSHYSATREAPPQPAAAPGPSAKTRQLSLPCNLPSQLEGIYDYVGLVKFNDDASQLVLQYRGQEGFTGSSFLGTKEHAFPLEKLDTIELKYGIGGCVMLITPNDLTVANKIPGMEKGKVRINFAREDRPKAEAMVRACAERSKLEAVIPIPPSESEALRDLRAPAIAILLYAMMCLLMTLVGSGAALTQVFTQPWFKTFLLGGSTLGATLNVFMIFGAIHMYFASNRNVAYAAAICCFVPTGPAAAAGIGLAIWALVVLNRDETTELFNRRRPETDRPPLYGFIDSSGEGKPPSQEVLREDAAARLRIPVALLRICGWFSVVGLLLTLGAYSLASDWTVVGQYSSWAYVLISLLATGSALTFARTDLSRSSLLALCIMGALPISLIWPLSVCFAAWALLVLLDPEVKEIHEQTGALPPAVPTGAMQVLGVVMLSIFIPLAVTLGIRNLRESVETPVPGQWELQDIHGGEFTIGDKPTLLERINVRLDVADSDTEVSMEHNAPVIDWQSGDVERQVRLVKLMGANGRIELALLRDADEGAQGALNAEAESDDLRFGALDASSPSWLRLAVVRNTRWKLEHGYVKSFDLTTRHSDAETQQLKLRFNSGGVSGLRAKLKEILKQRDDESKPLHLALIVDDVVYGSAKVVINEENPLQSLQFEGGFPWSDESELEAMLSTGPLGGNLVQVDADDE